MIGQIASYSPQWFLPKIDLQWCEKIVGEFQLHPILAKIFVSRGFSDLDEINKFLYAQLPDLYDPGVFGDIKKAVLRIITALERREHILIYGDNDVDGITGIALLLELFTELDVKVSYYVSGPLPGQQTLTETLLDRFDSKIDLLITVDCGITAGKDIKELTNNGIDVIITDHHQPTGKIPHCVAVLNPKLLNQNYSNRELTGVGVAFKLAHGIVNYLVSKQIISPNRIDLKTYLDLVALGTIADLGLLTGENRILVRYGMKQLQNTPRVGIRQLCASLDIDYTEITTTDIALKVAPRINSVGRVDDPSKGIDLLLVNDPEKINDLVRDLHEVNNSRQKMEQKVFAEAEQMLLHNPDLLKNKALVLYSSDWHPRLVPIISSRLAKQYNRPVIIIALDESNTGKGSVRTIQEFPLLQTLKKCKDYFINYGGHDCAAGLIIHKDKINDFSKKFIHIANFCLKSIDIVPKLFLDAEVDFKDLNYELLASLELLEPKGNGNPAPIFYCKVKQAWRPRIIAGQHLKLFLQQDDRVLEGIGFGMSNKCSFINSYFDQKFAVAYTPQTVTFNGKKSMQLLIKDIRLNDS
ncbi:MAG: single-stranded-DNA-specific exonuclease RecJ [Victivallaceae bacterium]